MPLLPPPPSSAVPTAADDEQLSIRSAARRAEDAGDLAGARRLLALLDDSTEIRDWSASLGVGLRCRNDVERALWQLQPAFRHGCTTAQRHVLLTLAADVLRTRGIAAVAAEPLSASCALRDPLLVDAGLFELGMLADYLRRVLLPAGHPSVPILQGWLGRPATVWEVRSVTADRLELTDLFDGAPTAVRAFRAGIDVGVQIYGRVVPVGSAGRFTTAPVPVDRVTARRVLRAVARAAPLAERLRAIAVYQRRSLAEASA